LYFRPAQCEQVGRPVAHTEFADAGFKPFQGASRSSNAERGKLNSEVASSNLAGPLNELLLIVRQDRRARQEPDSCFWPFCSYQSNPFRIAHSLHTQDLIEISIPQRRREKSSGSTGSSVVVPAGTEKSAYLSHFSMFRLTPFSREKVSPKVNRR